MGPRESLLIALVLLTGCATLRPDPSQANWRRICQDAPFHRGHTLSPAVLAELYKLPSFPTMDAVNARCRQ